MLLSKHKEYKLTNNLLPTKLVRCLFKVLTLWSFRFDKSSFILSFVFLAPDSGSCKILSWLWD